MPGPGPLPVVFALVIKSPTLRIMGDKPVLCVSRDLAKELAAKVACSDTKLTWQPHERGEGAETATDLEITFTVYPCTVLGA